MGRRDLGFLGVTDPEVACTAWGSRSVQYFACIQLLTLHLVLELAQILVDRVGQHPIVRQMLWYEGPMRYISIAINDVFKAWSHCFRVIGDATYDQTIILFKDEGFSVSGTIVYTICYFVKFLAHGALVIIWSLWYKVFKMNFIHCHLGSFWSLLVEQINWPLLLDLFISIFDKSEGRMPRTFIFLFRLTWFLLKLLDGL